MSCGGEENKNKYSLKKYLYQSIFAFWDVGNLNSSNGVASSSYLHLKDATLAFFLIDFKLHFSYII